MGLIKSPNLASAPSPFSLVDIEQQAHAIIVRAKSQAGRILTEAQRIADEVKLQAAQDGSREGRESGLAEGKKEGYDAGQQQALIEHRQALSQLIESLNSVTSQIDSTRSMIESETGRDVLQLAIAIARRVTKRLGATDPAVVSDNLMEAMKLAVHASDLRIAIHPSQKLTLEAALPGIQQTLPQLSHISLVEDQAISPGGCRIFTAGGQIDADLDAQIDRIAADLLPAAPPQSA